MGEGQARPLRPHRRRGQLGRDASRVSAASGCRTSSRSCPGSTDDAILILAHRDDTGVGPGANDNASGTAALIELARGYGRLGTVAGRPTPQHTLIFLSSDGGAYGGYGAERFASTSPYRNRIKAVVSLDGLAGSARPRLELAGFAATLARSGPDQDGGRPGRRPARPAAGSSRLARPARRPRHAVRLRRAGAVSRSQDLGDPTRDGAGQQCRRCHRHPGASQFDALSPPRAGIRVDPGVTRRRHRARGRHGRARLPGEPDHPWLGNRAGSADDPGPLPRRSDRPVRPQPAQAAAAARGAGGHSARGSASGSGSGSWSGSAPWPGCSLVARRSRRRPEAPRSATGPLPGSQSSACSRCSAGCGRAGC